MKLLVLMVCVTVSTLAWARDRNVDLRVTPATTRARLLEPAIDASEAQLRVEDRARGAQDRVVSALESAQHLGSRYHTWLWITPSLGYVNGASLRFDFQ